MICHLQEQCHLWYLGCRFCQLLICHLGAAFASCSSALSSRPQNPMLPRQGSLNGSMGSPPDQPISSSARDCIVLAPCAANEILPMNPEFPADLFTACLTTPILVALRWFITQNR
jgi:hypothetical protein